MSSSPASDAVTLIEMGPRDGLQNEPAAAQLPTATKLELVQRLATCGLTEIETTAFVSPQWVPAMADHAGLTRAVSAAWAGRPGAPRFWVLTPNLRGFEAAVAAGARHVAVFAAASESFSQRNINCSIAESMARFAPVLERAAAQGVDVRGYVSCVAGCPYDGAVAPAQVAAVARDLHQMGCCEVSLGDTIGVGTPRSILAMLDAVAREVPPALLAGHYHDTWGMAVANVYASWQFGLRRFDSAVAGLGGCPYAKGASGNVATEDLVWLFQGLGVETGVDLARLADTGAWISHQIGRAPASRAAQALRGQAPAQQAATSAHASIRKPADF
ncbi:hydroxymethylglutaryl-CoA lyase [Amphibiibacter pelophylacis]|uniref:Hydroxymethylglutaryl-CoA lyase n=1 Tax=Amphibiibacter pelophylacis TaxID=1799477 RepID=A0ACC6P2S6_9BURK